MVFKSDSFTIMKQFNLFNIFAEHIPSKYEDYSVIHQPVGKYCPVSKLLEYHKHCI